MVLRPLGDVGYQPTSAEPQERTPADDDPTTGNQCFEFLEHLDAVADHWILAARRNKSEKNRSVTPVVSAVFNTRAVSIR